MDTSSAAMTRRGLPRIGGLLLACAGVALIGRCVIGAVAAACSGAPIDWLALSAAAFDQNDLYAPLFLVALLMIELVQNGWRRSALRRVLSNEDASTRTDLFYCAAALTRLTPVIAVVLSLGLNQAIKSHETGPGLALFADFPPWLAVPGVLLVQSFAGYWVHRLMHTPLLWPLHAVHHAATDFNVITTLRHHPLDGVLAAIVLPLLPALLGFPTEAITIVILAVGAYTFYLHAELPTNTAIERFIAFGPNGHGIHHGRNASCYNTNYGDLVIWDRLFGTYKVEVAEPLAYGCADRDGIYQSGRPLRDMIAVQLACVRGLRRWARQIGRGSIEAMATSGR